MKLKEMKLIQKLLKERFKTWCKDMTCNMKNDDKTLCEFHRQINVAINAIEAEITRNYGKNNV